jgi:signal transduction histidine kinase
MQQIAAGAIVVSGATGAYVERVISPDGEVEVLGVAGSGVPPVGTRVTYPGSLTEEIVSRREPAFLTNLVGVGLSMAPYLGAHCAGCSVLVIPLFTDEVVLGALVILRQNSDAPFEFGVVNRARTLGDLASLALHRVLTISEAERRRDEAESAVRYRDDVLSIVSHDLRNPVATIMMSASLLGDADIPLDEAQRAQQLGVIRRSAERMNRLIGDLLDVGHIERGRLAIRCRCERPEQLVREACEAFGAVLESKSQTLTCEIADGLPAVEVDRDRIVQVLSNYLGNASKFTPAGGRIGIRAWADTGEVRFAVSDTGPGIPAEDRQRIFERFWQAKRTAHLGAGLGLAIAKGIAEAHRGRVWTESEVGAGSTFVLALPASSACE